MGTQAEEKFCLGERTLGIAVAIELQPRELEVRVGGPRREGDRPVERLLRRLVLPRPGKRLPVRESGGIRRGIEVRRVLERVQGGVLLAALVQRSAECDLRARPRRIELDGSLESGKLGRGFAGDPRDLRLDEERFGIERVRQRRAGCEELRRAGLTHGELRARHRAERAGIGRRPREHGSDRRQRAVRVPQGQLDSRLQQARSRLAGQSGRRRDDGVARGFCVTAGSRERARTRTRLVAKSALLRRCGAICLLGLDPAARAIEGDGEIELRRWQVQRLHESLELLHRLWRRRARGSRDGLAHQALRPLPSHSARVDELRNVDDRRCGHAELDALGRLHGHLVEQRRHAQRAGSGDAELARLRLRALQRLASLAVERFCSLRQRRAIQLSLFAIEPGWKRAGRDGLAEQHLRFAELGERAHRRLRLPHRDGLLGAALDRLQQGDLAVQRGHQRRPDFLLAEAFESARSQLEVRVGGRRQRIERQFLASLRPQRAVHALQLGPRPLRVACLTGLGEEPCGLAPGSDLQGRLLLHRSRQVRHVARHARRLVDSGAELREQGTGDQRRTRLFLPDPGPGNERLVDAACPREGGGSSEQRLVRELPARMNLDEREERLCLLRVRSDRVGKGIGALLFEPPQVVQEGSVRGEPPVFEESERPAAHGLPVAPKVLDVEDQIRRVLGKLVLGMVERDE